jgi:hypothetical protein
MRMRWAGHATCTGEITNFYKSLVGELQRIKPYGICMQLWENNAKINLKYV